jgi:hypothetical protein
MNWWAARTALTVVSAANRGAELTVCAIDAEAGRESKLKERAVIQLVPKLLRQAEQRANPTHESQSNQACLASC